MNYPFFLLKFSWIPDAVGNELKTGKCQKMFKLMTKPFRVAT